MRRITLAVGLMMALDAVLYLAIVPLLPYYADRFDLSRVEAGLIVACYPACVLLTTIPAGGLVGRVGGRRLMVLSGILFTIATLAFAFAPNAAALGLARGLQGCASGIAWSAGMAWLTANAAPEARGAAVGRAMAILAVGSIIGPAIGSLGDATSPELAFVATAVAGAVATAIALRAPVGLPLPPDPGLIQAARRMLAHPLVVAAVCIGTLDSTTAAVVDLLAPLELGRRGVDAWIIGAALVTGAVLGMLTAPYAGRVGDRVGPQRVAVAGGIGLVTVTLVFALPLESWQMLLLVALLGPCFTATATAMFPLAATGADREGLGHGVAYGIIGIGWALGFVIGPPIAGAIADSSGDTAGYIFAAVLASGLLAAAVLAMRKDRLAIRH